MENKFEFSAIVKSFAELKGSLKSKMDCIIHTGVSSCNEIELKNLAIEHIDNLSIYNDGEDEIYYFRFGKKEYYEYLPLGISVSELKGTVNNLVNPRELSPDDLMNIYQKGLVELSKIK
jgi:hypothetical protein